MLNQLPTYEQCRLIANWFTNYRSSLFPLSKKSLNRLFKVKHQGWCPHPMIFTIRSMLDKTYEQKNADPMYAKKLSLLFEKLDPKTMDGLDTLKDHLISYLLKSKLFLSAEVLQSVFKNHLLRKLIGAFKNDRLPLHEFSIRVLKVPASLFLKPVKITCKPAKTLPVIQLFARITTTEPRAYKLLTICQKCGPLNTINHLYKVHAQSNMTDFQHIHPSMQPLFQHLILSNMAL